MYLVFVIIVFNQKQYWTEIVYKWKTLKLIKAFGTFLHYMHLYFCFVFDCV